MGGMDEDELLKLATSVARHTLNLFGVSDSEQWVEDVAQVAVVAMWLVERDARTRQYLRDAGRWAATNFIIRFIFEYKGKSNHAPPYAVELDSVGEEFFLSPDAEADGEEITDEELRVAISRALRHEKKQRGGQRTEKSLSRMVEITIMLLDKAPAAEIAERVGVPPAQIKTYIARARARIEQYLQYRERFLHCKKCGADRRLTTHHIIPYRAGGRSGDENEATLCEPCHAALENFILRRQWRGMPAGEYQVIFNDWLSLNPS